MEWRGKSSVLGGVFKHADLREIYRLTLEDLLKLLDEYPDAFVMVDSKQYSVRNYQRTLEDYAQYREIAINAGIQHTLGRLYRRFTILLCIREQHFFIDFQLYLFPVAGLFTEELITF